MKTPNFNVSDKILNKVLDYIHSSNGVSKNEIIKNVKISPFTTCLALKKLKEQNCISEGDIKHIRKRKNIYIVDDKKLIKGYFYESDY